MAAGVLIAGWVCMAISGIFLAIQSGVNLTLGANIGKSLAAVVSFGTGLFCLAIMFIVDTQGLKSPLPTRQGAANAPWWAWFGGPLGAFYVASIIIFGPKLGAANALSVFVALQLTTALILDSFGLAGYKKKPFHWARALGLVFLVVGVVLVAKFEGKDKSKTDQQASASATADKGSGGNTVCAAEAQAIEVSVIPSPSSTTSSSSVPPQVMAATTPATSSARKVVIQPHSIR